MQKVLLTGASGFLGKKVLDIFKYKEYDVVIGENNLNIDIIKTIITNMSNVNFYIQIDNISEIMSRADLSIGAGGSVTVTERNEEEGQGG